jgi:ATP-binding cassette subfamily B protein
MLKQVPPPPLAARLAAAGISQEDILLCTDTDIDLAGHYVPQWIVATADRLAVFSSDELAPVVPELKFSDATEFRCQSVIGSGLLQARVDGLYVTLLRFSNRLADRFHKVARKLDRHLHGEPITVLPGDDRDPRRCPKCDLMLQFVGDVCPRCVDKGAVLARMWTLMKPYRSFALMMMGLLLLGICLDLVAPQLTRYLVDHVLPGGEEAAAELKRDTGAIGRHLAMLMQIVGVLALVQILRMFLNIVNGRLGAKIGTAVTFDMRNRLVQHLQQLSVSYYDKQQVGSLVGRVAYDTEALHGFVMQLTGGFLFQIIMVVGVGLMMLSMNPKLTLYTILPAPLVVAGSLLFWRFIYPRYYRFWDASSKQAGMLAGTLSGIRVVKAFSQEDHEMERFSRVSSRLLHNRRNVDYSTAAFNPVMALIFQMGGWIVWFVGGRDVLTGAMTLGSLIAFFAYLQMFYGPLGQLTQFTTWLTQFVTQAHRIFEILDTPPEIAESADPVKVEKMRGGIEFDRVSFGYDRHTPVLQDLSLEIAAGEMIGIVGRSGSGKTTVVNLISRFYDVDEGRVLLDGVDVRNIQRDSLRNQVGVVLQEPFLFRGSIWQNVTYGRPDAKPEEIISAAKAANAHDFIMRAAHGYDTWVGERGAGLSGGERQRISIARVLLTDPRILILDEATSSVDAESEAAIQAALAEVVKGRTTIAIAHRLSTLRNADRILVVDRGKIVESGPHAELVNNGGLYAKLVRIQGQMTQPSVEQLAHQMARPTIDMLAEKADGAEAKPKPAGDEEFPWLRTHHPRWMEPGAAFVHRGNLGALHVTVRDECSYGGIYAVRCMPVHFPEEYISLRFLNSEKREMEVGIIRDLRTWPAEARALVEESLEQRYFVHIISAVHDIHLYNGYLNFKVDTHQGPMQFMLRWQHDRAHDYGEGGKMLLDTDENRYLVPDVRHLPQRDRALFQRFIYW